MNKQQLEDTDLKSLMDMLESKDGMIRQKARESLVALGKPAVISLIQALRNSALDQVRWEAAKALGEISDARSIPSLVKALEDSNPDVAWLAAVALSRFNKTAWPPLLRALIQAGPDAVSLRQGAHHVLVNQKGNGFDDLLAKLVNALDPSTLMDALEPSEVSETVTVAAHEILVRIKAKE